MPSLQRIRAVRAALRARLASVGTASSGEGQPIEVMERVQDAVVTEVHAGAQRVLLARLAALARAEERLQDGRYGVCETCGEAIPVRRLQALPEARQCVGCAEAAESRDATSPGLAAHRRHLLRSAA
jgi:RNA polymerase-binding transcription factor DksA